MSRVLVVDDEAAVRAVVQRTLASAGHEVIAAASGEEALGIIMSNVFDAAVVDYMIPPPNGVELLARLRELQPWGARILMSGCLDMPTTLRAVNRCELSQVLQKPCEPARLVSIVAQSIDNRRRGGATVPPADTAKEEETGEPLERCLRTAAIHLALQPIVNATGQVVAHEALLRSSDPLLRRPRQLYEAAGRAQRLGELCDLFVRNARDALASAPGEKKLFIKLQLVDAADSKLKVRLEPLLRYTDRVVFDVAEPTGLDRSGVAMAAELQRLGFEVAINDRGSGNSPLSLLAELKPRYVKIGVGVMHRLHEREEKRRLVEVICRVANTAGLVVIGEGIETDDEARAARECGVAWLQGYRFGTPKGVKYTH
jgi:EAL domain-containing protein (putative c-di-GMP-specific phosphodiesterase class I)